MRRLEKIAPPGVLVRQGATWTQALVEHERRGSTPSDAELRRYNHPDIKNALLEECRGKCAYCESKFRHVAYGDIEHITPKKHGATYYFCWDNLTIACDVCNTLKGCRSDLLDPYVDDVDSAFYILGPMLFATAGDDKALATEAQLKLNRIELLERRKARLSYLHRMFLLANKADESTRSTLIDALRGEIADVNEEYTSFAIALSRVFGI